MLIWLTLNRVVILDRGQWLLIGPLILFWLWLLRHFPGQWLKIKRDLQLKHVKILQGLANVYVKPGVLLSPSRTILAVQGKTFSADGLKPVNLYPGAEVRVRYATESQCLLSVQQVAEKGQTDTEALMLSPQEQALLKLISQGLGDKHIARELNLSPSTVRTYNSALYRKLAVNDRKQAIEKARELGVGDVD
ncbi:helix-turn-helix transcriptional regulator [Lacimicrobium alkaliphilum]|uniref:helix-turn-helix transcriptional regulator n=1 Tax=Lacimicrobium alkaliphilum TaxID=1526571 RepID=UPI0012E333CF|nr:LuxR C-terminal-related transcriptional regulator [Lacimicrobium alkaliphilum]